jgi:hypothetical protein
LLVVLRLIRHLKRVLGEGRDHCLKRDVDLFLLRASPVPGTILFDSRSELRRLFITVFVLITSSSSALAPPLRLSLIRGFTCTLFL